DDDQNQVDYVAADHWGDRTGYWMEDVRLNGTIGQDIDYLAGLYYLGQDISTDRRITLGADLVAGSPSLTTKGQVHSHDYSAYGNINYRFLERWTASLGLRLSQEKRTVDFIQASQVPDYPSFPSDMSVSNGNVSPTGALSYQLTPDVMTYARIA